MKETGILVSCSDYHIFKKMHLTRKQAMDKYLGIVKAALDRGIRPVTSRTSPVLTSMASSFPSPKN